MKTITPQLDAIFSKTNRADWELVKFGDFAFNISERVEPSDTDAEIYVGLEHLDSDSIHIRRKGVPSDVKGTKLRVYKGDIIFGKRRAYQRKAAIADFDGICSAHAMVIRANPEKIDPKFFPFFIHSDAFMRKAVEISEGSLSPTIKWKTLSEQEFRLPPQPVQRKISELLWSLDRLQEKILSAEKKSNTLFEASLDLLRGGNKKWNEVPLGQILDLHYGKGLKESERQVGDYDVVSSAGVCGKHDKYLVKGPGIVVGRKGSVGEITWVEKDFWPIDTAYWVSLKGDDYDLRFAYYVLLSAKLARLSISTAIPGINRDDILAVKVNVPELKEQISFRESLEKLRSLSNKYTENLQALANMKASILSSIL